MTRYTIHANGTFWGIFDADGPEAAMQAAADKHGTDGDTTGMIAWPLAEYMADLRGSCFGVPIEGHVMEWANCKVAEVDAEGDIWIAEPQAGHWVVSQFEIGGR